MRLLMLIPCLIVAVNCHPLAQDEYNSQASGLALIEENNDAALRSKRTVGVLRQFFPEITEMIDNIVNKIVSEVIKVVGPTVIQDVLGGNRRQNNGNSKTESEGSEVTIEVPADFFGDSESDSDVADINNKDNFGKVNIPLPTFETTQVTGKGIGNVEEGLTTEGRVQLNYLDHYTASNRRVLHQDMDIAESENKEVRVAFDDSDLATNEAGADLTSLDDIEIGDDENRNKRFSGGNGESGGSSGGSGNFIFDIIRLIAGSGSSSPPSEDHTHGKHEPDEAVPGPATRFLVIAKPRDCKSDPRSYSSHCGYERAIRQLQSATDYFDYLRKSRSCC